MFIMNVLNQRVLLLNANWMPIAFITVKKALEDMNSSKSPKLALKIEYDQDEHGNFDFSRPTEMLPLAFKEWITISPRKHDVCGVNTPHLVLRVPTVVISKSYNKIPVRTFRPVKSVLFSMQKGVCGYTGEQMTYKEATLDHLHPKSRGGKNTFQNLVLCKQGPNLRKGNRTPEEAGMKPLFRHKEPAPIPATVDLLRTAVGNPDWEPFLFNGK